MTAEDCERKFLEPLKYVKFIKMEKLKINCFLCDLNPNYKGQITMAEPQTLEGAIQKAKCCET
jgi:hypothetical protein